MSAPSNFFNFQFPLDFHTLPALSEEKVCIIAVVGKAGSREKKAAIIDQYVGRQAFDSRYEGPVSSYQFGKHAVMFLHCRYAWKKCRF